MPLNVKADGVWRTASRVHTKVNGEWVVAKQVWGYANGGWISVWQNEVRYVNTVDRTAASIHELMGYPSQPGTYIFENRAKIVAGTASYALRTGFFPAGSTLIIINTGTILGRGGAGGAGRDGAGNVAPGGPGGAALYLDCPCSLDTGMGYIMGGGGGGGGALIRNASGNMDGVAAGGGGGAGVVSGSAGSSQAAWAGGGNKTISRLATDGTESQGGAGATGSFLPGVANGTVVGGQGGSPGQPGFKGTARYSSGSFFIANGAAGAAGPAIVTNGYALNFIAGNNDYWVKGPII